ncbi:N(4)-acetylcytidine aminohydrolase [Aeromonas schubertii]|uniref:N(4)-acetylcytidine amidohydrolase n=1 Tax=Aeromonas schubertii TaxID=652 RepID=A0ABS7V8C6_9GAMM|nr:N(4)-acetylcytidine aminohydrolase [Aeromonas schubertii]MBZ6065651.1 N(4)-acetylcytidine aminohydrolase [Aeromonas schubertii]
MSHPAFTFYSRFVDDIRAGRKTITIRDESETNWQPGQRLSLFTNPEQIPFGTIEVLSVTPVPFDALTGEHARQENMTLEELRAVIRTIYPHLPPLYVIRFRLI